MNRIGCGKGIGGPLRHALQGENFIRHIGNDKLIFDFHEGQGTVCHDLSHNSNNGTFGAGAAAPTWKRNSLNFDGGDYVDLTGIAHGISAGECTFCFALDNLNNASMLFGQQITYAIVYIDTSKVRWLIAAEDTGSTTDVVTTAKPLSLQIMRDGSGNVEVYVNGKSGDKGKTNTGDHTYNGSSVVRLGSNFTANYYIIATMYSFRILNKGLSGIECQQEYLANKFSNN